MAVKVGINGFGRIGRLVVRAAIERKADVEFVAANDITDAATLAHLLRYDSIHGVWPVPVSVSGDDIKVGGQSIHILKVQDPKDLPWKSLGVDVVLEATGKFTDKDKAMAHIGAGARVVAV